MDKDIKRVCVLGLGHIGLPMACVIASRGHYVHGTDINLEVIKRIKSGNVSFLEEDLRSLLESTMEKSLLEVSTNVSAADIYIIAVPTPLNTSDKPDMSFVLRATEAIMPLLKRDDLILMISTCPIGTSQVVANKVQEHCSGVYVACCPERAIPGNIIYELVHNTRIVGGVDEPSTNVALNFYRSFVHGPLLSTDSSTAEAAKLAENAYRNLNIAYANELSMIADQVGLDGNEIIRLANTHPRVSILSPGIGVGGHCLPIDPLFLVDLAPELALLCRRAREVNQAKTHWVMKQIVESIRKNNVKTVACLGLTYKPDTSDTRESPAMAIVNSLQKEAEMITFDPYADNAHSLEDTIQKADMVVFLVGHKAFKNIDPHDLKRKIVLDFVGISQ